MIRKARKTDIPELVKLVKKEKTVEDYPGEYSTDVFKQMLKDKDTMLFVIEEDKKPIAFQEFKIDKSQKRIYLETIIVSKKYRGRGLASTLIKKVENFAKSKKFKRISFVTRKWNKPMNFLARKQGFKQKDELIYWEKML